MLLSFNIPTYNRCYYLKKNIEIIASQIRENNLFTQVEINISDNASSDETELVVNNFIKENRDIKIKYCRNSHNEGPDANYIKTMKLAKGEYSILWGDDDFLKENALNFIVNKIKTSDCNFFISNRSNIDGEGNFICEQSFFDENVKERVYDFDDEDQLLSYFSSVRSLGGCFTFISSVIYKTDIIEEMGEYDHRFDGTYYSFFYYWWGWLLKGNKVHYLATSYLYCTTKGKKNSDTFGLGIDRALVDFDGFDKIGDILFSDKLLAKRFKACVIQDHPSISLIYLHRNEPRKFKCFNAEYLERFGYAKSEISLLLQTCSIYQMIKNVIKYCLCIIH